MLCVICLEPCSRDEIMYADSCQCGPIVIHRGCQRGWTTRHNDCPVCRTPKTTPIVSINDPDTWALDGEDLDEVEPHVVAGSAAQDPPGSVVTVDPVDHDGTRQVSSRRRRLHSEPVSAWFKQLVECCIPGQR